MAVKVGCAQSRNHFTNKSGTAAALYIRLLPLQPDAVSRAKEIYKEISYGNPTKEESSTMVYQLIEQLNEFV